MRKRPKIAPIPAPMSVERWAAIRADGELTRVSPEKLLCFLNRRPDNTLINSDPDETLSAILLRLREVAWPIIVGFAPEGRIGAEDDRDEIHGRVMDQILSRRGSRSYRKNFKSSVYFECRDHRRSKEEREGKFRPLDEAAEVSATHLHYKQRALDAEAQRESDRLNARKAALLAGIANETHRRAVEMHLDRKSFKDIGLELDKNSVTISRWVGLYVPKIRKTYRRKEG